jgi:hypothetical protein
VYNSSLTLTNAQPRCNTLGTFLACSRIRLRIGQRLLNSASQIRPYVWPWCDVVFWIVSVTWQPGITLQCGGMRSTRLQTVNSARQACFQPSVSKPYALPSPAIGDGLHLFVLHTARRISLYLPSIAHNPAPEQLDVSMTR